MNRLPRKLLVLAAVLSAAVMTVSAAEVCFHLDNPGQVPPRGLLRIYATIDCEIQEPPLFDDWVVHCQEVCVEIPNNANDLMIKFAWDYWCHNEDDTKSTPANWDGTQWILEDIGQWINDNVTVAMEVPVIGDATGELAHIYDIVNLNEWAADPRPLMDEYRIVNGESPDLPGYLIGTTPIVFNPTEPNPFSTTRVQDFTLVRHARVTYRPTGAIPTVSEWGLIVMTLLLLTAGTIVLVRMRRRRSVTT